MKTLLMFAGSVLMLAASGAPASAPDPAGADPAAALQPSAEMQEIAIQSGGSRINGLVYLAAGAGPHPVVIFLHGYPGNERNLDLAQAVRRAGYQAIYVDYRGAWGSAGTFSFAHGREDVAAMLAWVRQPEIAAKYHVDPARIALVGHSYGGWLALMNAAQEPAAVCVAALAAWDVGWQAARFAAHADERAENLDYFRSTTDPADGPIHADPAQLIDEMSGLASADYVAQAPALKNHALLLIAATRDSADEGVERHAQLLAAIRAAGGTHARMLTFDDDHPFSSHRIALAKALTQWLRTDCAATQPAASAKAP